MTQWARVIWLALAGFLWATPLQAAEPPVDAGSLLREQTQKGPREEPQVGIPRLTLPASDQRDDDGAATGARVTVRRFVLTGDISAFPRDRLQLLLEPSKGRSLTLAELRDAVSPITALYRARGYFLARARLPAQDVTDGTVKVQIEEGRLDSTDGVSLSNPPRRLNAALPQRIVSQSVKAGEPLRLEDIERSVLLLNDLPGVSAGANLEAGALPGTTRLVLDVTEAPPLTAQLTADNHGSRYTQSNRLGATVWLNDPTGLGDQAVLNLFSSPNGDYRYGRLAYSLLANPNGLRLGAAVSDLHYVVGQELAALNAKGSADVLALTATLPIVRSRVLNVRASALLQETRLRNEALGSETSNKRVDLINAGVAVDRIDDHGFTLADLTFSVGHLDLGRNAESLAQDRGLLGAGTQGTFAKAVAGLTRTQRLTRSLEVTALMQGQLASKNLDSSEKFLLGGPDGVRAYPTSEGAGDSGLRATVEGRWVAASHPAHGDLSLQAFADWGHVRQLRQTGDLVLGTPNSYSIAGAGFGASVVWPGRGELRAQWAHKVGSNPGRNPITGHDSDGHDSRSRVWLSATVSF